MFRPATVIVTALLAVGCRSKDAAIVFHVDTDATVMNKAGISQLMLTIDGRQRIYPVTKALPGSLAAEVHAGEHSVVVDGSDARTVLGRWSGMVTVPAGEVVTQQVVLSCAESKCGMPLPDGGTGDAPPPDTWPDVPVADTADGSDAPGGPEGPYMCNPKALSCAKCDPVCQVGCDTGTFCNFAIGPACSSTTGVKFVGSACEVVDVSDAICPPGYYSDQTGFGGTTKAKCRKLCYTDADCTTGGKCVLQSFLCSGTPKYGACTCP